MRTLLLLSFVLASGASAQALDPLGSPSPLLSHRDVLVDGTSAVGRWVAVEVLGDRTASGDLERSRLTKVLVINPTGRATLRGWDRRLNGGRPEAFIGRVYGNELRLDDLPGMARLQLQRQRLYLTDPGGTTTVYVWQGR